MLQFVCMKSLFDITFLPLMLMSLSKSTSSTAVTVGVGAVCHGWPSSRPCEIMLAIFLNFNSWSALETSIQ